MLYHIPFYYTQFLTNLFLFVTGISGAVIHRTNILVFLMCIELILLSANLNFITTSFIIDNHYGQLFSLFILTIAAAESSIGLAILIAYYRIRGNINLNKLLLKG